MKTTALLLLAALVGASLAWYVVANRATAAEVARWQGKLEDQEDSTAAWRNRAQATEAALLELGAQAQQLYRAHAVSQEASAAAIATIRALAQDSTARQAPTARAVLTDAAVAIETASNACNVVVTNCEQRAALEQRRADDATRRVEALVATQDTTAAKLKQAERAASPGFLGLRSAWNAKAQLGLVALLVVLLRQ